MKLLMKKVLDKITLSNLFTERGNPEISKLMNQFIQDPFIEFDEVHSVLNDTNNHSIGIFTAIKNNKPLFTITNDNKYRDEVLVFNAIAVDNIFNINSFYNISNKLGYIEFLEILCHKFKETIISASLKKSINEFTTISKVNNNELKKVLFELNELLPLERCELEKNLSSKKLVGQNNLYEFKFTINGNLPIRINYTYKNDKLYFLSTYVKKGSNVQDYYIQKDSNFIN